MVISFNDIGQVCVSFAVDGNLQVGEPCKMSRSSTVIRGAEGDVFIGKVMAVRDNMATIAVKGCTALPYTGNLIPIGYTKLSCDGNGAVCTNAEGKEYLVIAVDPINHMVTVLL